METMYATHTLQIENLKRQLKEEADRILENTNVNKIRQTKLENEALESKCSNLRREVEVRTMHRSGTVF